MFKLFQGLLGTRSKETTDKNDSISDLAISSQSQSEIEKADLLWEQGKLQEAITVYSQAIEENRDRSDIYQQILIHLQQQGNIGQAYQKLASVFKQEGQSDKAANYFRDAIVIKSATQEIKEKYHKLFPEASSLSSLAVADLKSNAFSFQPELNSFSLDTKVQKNIIQIELPENYTFVSSKSDRGEKLKLETVERIESEIATDYMQEALEYCEGEKWENAAIACQLAVRIKPKMAEAYKIWGNALQRMHKTAEAMDCYAKAVEIEPDLAKVYAGIAKLYSGQQKWEKAVEFYQKAIIIKPNFADAYNSLARVWEQFGNPEQSKICAHRAIELENNSSSLLLNPSNSKGISQEKRDRLARLKKVQQLVQNGVNNETLAPIDPNIEAVPQITTTKPKIQESQLDKAIRRYHKHAKLKPSSAKIKIDLGKLYAKKKKWQSAIACYKKALRIEPKNALAHLNLAKALSKSKLDRESIEQMYKALSLDPKLGTGEQHYHLGNALWKLKQNNKAIECYQRAIEQQPSLYEAYHSLGEKLKEMKKYTEALECYQKAVNNNPDDVDSCYYLGELLADKQDWYGSVKAYRRVLELRPRYPEATQRLNHALSEKLKLDLLAKKKS